MQSSIILITKLYQSFAQLSPDRFIRISVAPTDHALLYVKPALFNCYTNTE